jgi:hypothetical protein
MCVMCVWSIRLLYSYLSRLGHHDSEYAALERGGYRLCMNPEARNSQLFLPHRRLRCLSYAMSIMFKCPLYRGQKRSSFA